MSHHAVQIEIAIITPDTLSALGLKGCIEGISPQCIVRTFPDFGAFADDTPDMYTWYFVTAQTYALYNAFFLPRKEKTIILLHAIEGMPIPAAAHVLNTSLPKQQLNSDLAKYLTGNPSQVKHESEGCELTEREIEVLILVSKGLINKEIADKLNIGLTTVITHRKNITEKLGIKSVSGLTMYAVMMGFIEANRI